MDWIGLLLVSLGTALLGICIFEFARTGRGTLAPMDPPRVLVVRGLYRYVRNPMYLSVTLIVWGEILLARSTALLVYWFAWFTAANLFVRGYEEPALRRRFGSHYDSYAARVGRWFPKFGALKRSR
jgi:protein-S-isoprenylcysteine O-methyltransferase Ste14